MFVTVSPRLARILHHYPPILVAFICFVFVSMHGFDSAWYRVVAGFAVVLVPALLLHRLLTTVIRARCPACGSAMQFVRVRTRRVPGPRSRMAARTLHSGYECGQCGHEAMTEIAEDSGHSMGE